MNQAPRRGRPTREEGAAIEERLRSAALDSFVVNGFDGTTMEAVAAAAGVTKRTLYARYGDKRALFAAVVPWALSRLPLNDVALGIPAGDLETSLRLIAEAVLATVTDPEVVKLRRLALLEAHRFPEFASEANLDTWRQNVKVVVDLLEAQLDSGAVVVDDLELAADQFIAMIAGASTILADFGVRRSREDEARHIDQAVTLFLSGILPRKADPVRQE
ncbi:MAG TPA: TetR/AcrR family transcriptional regulator [Microthrixaceae bacterium]|nr:TetR/AcrR family transcriptional regulator [Microthrixaceae bacterium]